MGETYKVVIKGAMDGFTENQVISNLAPLFKTTEDIVRPRFKTSNFVVKNAVDLQTAEKYKAVLEQQGCVCSIEPESKPNSTIERSPVTSVTGSKSETKPILRHDNETTLSKTRDLNKDSVDTAIVNRGYKKLITNNLKSWGIKAWVGIAILLIAGGYYLLSNHLIFRKNLLQLQNDHLAQLQKKAESGDPKSQTELGLMYSKGIVIPKNGAKALEWFQKAINQDDARAKYYYAMEIYSESDGNRDLNKAAEMLQQALPQLQKDADQGDVSAIGTLGNAYAHGDGVPRNSDMGIKLLEMAANQGDIEAEKNLGRIFTPIALKDVTKNGYAKTIELYKKAVLQGDGEAMLRLGEVYYKIAEHSYDEAQYRLGNSSYKASGIPYKDLSESLKLYQDAASLLANGEAENRIGDMYWWGIGVPRDREVSLEWIKKGAAKGNLDSKKSLQQIAGPSSQSSSSQSSSQTGDPVARYAENLAQQFEKSQNPTCQMIASNIRSFGNSSAPDNARQRQIDALVDQAPRICF